MLKWRVRVQAASTDLVAHIPRVHSQAWPLAGSGMSVVKWQDTISMGKALPLRTCLFKTSIMSDSKG